MPETLGRGSFEDESRIERESKRPHENPPVPDDDGVLLPSSISDTIEAVRATVHSILTGESFMSNSFAHQKELLFNLKSYLSQFQQRLIGVSASYQSKLDELHAAGMMDETYQSFLENELAQTQAMIRNLVEHIGGNDIPKVQKEIDFLESH